MEVEKRIPSLDGLRAISIAMVILGHMGGTRGFPWKIPFYDQYANFGVRIFFVISGYLITSLLLKEHAKNGFISIRKFYLRRAFRILPAAYVFMTIVVIFAWPHLSRKEVLAAYFYLSNYVHGHWLLGHLWSLSIEEQFYLLWPVLVAFWFHRKTQIAVIGILAGPVLRILFYKMGWLNISHYFPTVGDALATGCLLAILWPEMKRFDSWIFSKKVLPVIAATVLIPITGDLHGLFSQFYNSIGLTLMHVGIAIIIYLAVCRKFWVLNLGWVTWVGTMSYSLYLWQQVFLYRTSTAWWTAFPQNLLLVFLVASLSFYLIERPFLRLRHLLG